MAGKTKVFNDGRTPNQRYSAALTKLRERHLEEFQTILADEWTADGVARPLTPAEREAARVADKREKAAAKLRGILTEFPDLIEETGTSVESA